MIQVIYKRPYESTIYELHDVMTIDNESSQDTNNNHSGRHSGRHSGIPDNLNNKL